MIDFWERWTFGRFLRPGVLALAFESGQPWAEYGSYGDRYGGVEVMALDTAAQRWYLAALEYDYRGHDEDFVPGDIAWHERGVLAWLVNDLLAIQVLRRPRGPIGGARETRDSDTGLEYSTDLPGRWRELTLDNDGLMLTARAADRADVVDLAGRRYAPDGGAWEPLEVWSPGRE